MTYTSGEWKKDGLSVIVAQRGIICKCPVVSGGGVFDVEANARLIAAAPALLEALDGLLDGLEKRQEYEYEEDDGEGGTTFVLDAKDIEAEITEGKQALAQAEGE